MAKAHAITTALKSTSESAASAERVQEDEPASEDAITNEEPTEETTTKPSVTTVDTGDEPETPVAEAADPSEAVPPAPDATQSNGDNDANAQAAVADHADDDVDGVVERFQGLFRSSYHRFADGHIEAGEGWDGDTFTSSSGNVYDTTRPPPQPCCNCPGQSHWRKDCPKARIYP